MRMLSLTSIRNLALAVFTWVLLLGYHPVEGISLYSGPSIVYETVDNSENNASDFSCCKVGLFTQINALCFNARCSVLYALIQKSNKPVHYFSIPLSVGMNLFNILYIHTGFIIKTLLRGFYNKYTIIGNICAPMVGLGFGTEKIQFFINMSTERFLEHHRNNSSLDQEVLHLQLNFNVV